MTAVADFLRHEIVAGSFPGAAGLVGSSEAIAEIAWAGDAAIEPEKRQITGDTLFDLASLTKPLCTGALVAAAGTRLPIDAEPGRFLPEWKKTRFDGITLEHLLTHTSGLAAWYPLYARGEGAASYRKTLSSMEPEASPGKRVIYSDLNFLLLTDILEVFFSAPIDRVFTDLVASPTGSGAHFLPKLASTTAATEKDDRVERAMTEARGLAYPRFRTGVVWGEVHDGNAYRRGGVAGNAGLFGTARDVWALARHWLAPDRIGYGADSTPGLSEARGLAWQGHRGAGSSVPEMSPRSFGHTGFTGTSVWIDPDGDRIAVLLTNRIHPEVKEVPFNEVRQRFHSAVYTAFG
ncbi:MAG TPA: serine hydrolase domain-containing protein [Thermoanaerobaculia bacterium]